MGRMKHGRPYLIKDHHLISFFYHQLSVLRVTFKVIHHSSLWQRQRGERERGREGEGRGREEGERGREERERERKGRGREEGERGREEREKFHSGESRLDAECSVHTKQKKKKSVAKVTWSAWCAWHAKARNSIESLLVTISKFSPNVLTHSFKN